MDEHERNLEYKERLEYALKKLDEEIEEKTRNLQYLKAKRLEVRRTYTSRFS